MNEYIILKVIHIISSTVLFGTGLGIAFFKWSVDRTGNVSAIRAVSEKVVLADWLFTTPAIIIQPLTGIALATKLGHPLFKGWLLYSLVLYGVAGMCWLPVVVLQIQMKRLARDADRQGVPLDERYWVRARRWYLLGIPAFASLVAVFWLMVSKPG